MSEMGVLVFASMLLTVLSRVVYLASEIGGTEHVGMGAEEEEGRGVVSGEEARSDARV